MKARGNLQAGCLSRGCLRTECELPLPFQSPMLLFPQLPLWKAEVIWVQKMLSLTLKYAFMSLSTSQKQSLIFPTVQLGKPRHRDYALLMVT